MRLRLPVQASTKFGSGSGAALKVTVSVAPAPGFATLLDTDPGGKN